MTPEAGPGRSAPTEADDHQSGAESTQGHSKAASKAAQRWWRPSAWNGKALYERVSGPAEAIKAAMQMVIGITTIVWIPLQLRHIHYHTGKYTIAQFGLRGIAIGLAFAAAVELAYTLFTQGPDEALDPLILGLSAFALIQISDPDAQLLSPEKSTSIILLILGIAALFVLREVFIERPKRLLKEEQQSQEPASVTASVGAAGHGSSPRHPAPPAQRPAPSGDQARH